MRRLFSVALAIRYSDIYIIYTVRLYRFTVNTYDNH
jgi:hypothetical protein